MKNMTRKIKTSELPDFDMSQVLQDELGITAYLNMMLEENDPAELAHALGVIAKACGMATIAKETGLTREALYRALRPSSQPRFDTIQRVSAALGVRLVAEPISQA